ncbi:hypothetical protein G9U51_02185 [Calidifontibacter sp. DB0510]|uniref:Uncharacterized protein n=1 Tax=Metallococcus carri TaxID=1656884 RepID=A0A967EG35_9MICO|nr:hypothetical protein [Metallococcus carri]NHN54588.1 hypothetical protein [Metallococcus carri]NOP36573.1 hypothetical protein [Calidifontibacter sp. DB2511S]
MKGKVSSASRLSGTPAVQRIVDRARQAARDTAARMPRADQPTPLRAADLSGVRLTDLLTDGAVARRARRMARSLGLARTVDDTGAWAALGGLAALLRVVDDGGRRSVVVDTAGPRSTFSRWAEQAGFAPVHFDVMRPDVVGEQVPRAGVDMVARLHPHSTQPETVDEDLTRASWALRRGGLLSVTMRLGPADEGGVGLADLRSIIARAGEQGLSVVGDLDIRDGARHRSAHRADASYGLALLTFRRR